MRKLFQRTVTAILAAATAASLAGCGGEPASGTANPGSAGTAASESNSGEPDRTPYKFTYFNTASWDGTTQFGSDKVSQAMAEKFNIEIEMQKADSDPVSKLNTMLASDSLPHLIFWNTDENWYKMQEKGKFIELNQFFDKYSYLQENIDESTLNLLSIDGKLYGVPNWPSRKPTGGNDGYVYVKKIYEQAGSPALKTPDDVLKYAEKVRDLNLTVDGRKVIPVTTQSGDALIAEIYGAYGGISIDGTSTIMDGKLAFRYRDPVFKQAVLFVNQMWREGLLSEDLYNQTTEQLAETLAAGATGIHIGDFVHYLDTVNGCRRLLLESDPDNDYVAIDYPMADGVTPENFYGGCNNKTTGWGMTSITTKAEKPERIYEWMNWCLTKEASRIQVYGPQGEMWNDVDDNGNPILFKFEGDLTEEEVRDLGLWKWCIPAQADNIDSMKFAVNASLPEEKQNWTSAVQASILTPRMWSSDEFMGLTNTIEQKSDLSIARQQIRDYITKNLPMAVMADSAEKCSAIFDDILAFAEANGIAQIEEKYQEKWDANKAIMGVSHVNR